eukprot:TRINITY_DN9116_c0_g3_i1.p1 TRINITY_DN9116_c0_g3~~TRINITY_DN9116_c0_g3_i1.p1  ORF type:complete len:545 (-),score=211.27 TRINITY_DN9116_c0_g3_i1:107-1741(-)
MFRNKKDEDRKPVEQEIAELQRKFRVLENDKRAYSEDSQGIIRKQRATIEKLTRENKKMKSEISETRGSNATGPEQRMSAEGLKKLADQKEQLLAKIEAEEEHARALGEQLDQTSKNIMAVRVDMGAHGGCNAALENAKAVQKQIRVLENRLDHAVQNFNIAIAANKKLRENIDTLRRERLVFDDIYKKLENELAQKKKEMASIIDQANAAYEARDSAQAQMAALKQQADKEHSEFEKEWRELGRLIENDKRMKEFMRNKAKGLNDSKSVEAIRDLKREKSAASRNNWELTKTGAPTNVSQERVNSYEEAFARIQAATGICEIDELVQTFINAEDQNYSFFKYNNLLREDIEKMEAQIAEYKDEYISLSGSSSRKEDTERLRLLTSLEEKLSQIEQRADSYDIRYQESQQTLSHLRSQIDALFHKMQCSIEDLPPGCGSGISEENMMSYLAAIEARTNELLKLNDALAEEEDGEDAQKPSRPVPSGSSLPIRLPSTVEEYSDEDEDEDEDDQRPFTWEELKAKTLKGISKKARKTRMKGGNGDK